MEKTIEEKLIIEIARIDERIEYLKGIREDYIELKDSGNIRVCHVKIRQLTIVNDSLKKIIT